MHTFRLLEKQAFVDQDCMIITSTEIIHDIYENPSGRVFPLITTGSASMIKQAQRTQPGPGFFHPWLFALRTRTSPAVNRKSSDFSGAVLIISPETVINQRTGALINGVVRNER